MKIIDISWPISENMTAYKDKKVVKIEETKNFEKDGARESLILLGSHSGTHIDAPAHFLKDGKRLDQLSLDRMSGRCQVLDFSDKKEKITKEDLEAYSIESDDIILLKTKNSQKGPNDCFDYDFVYLDASGAEYLASKKVKAVGIDYLGIERNQPKHESHEHLLDKDILIIEGLRLSGALPREYFLYCLPLNIPGVEAAPARAILVERVS